MKKTELKTKIVSLSLIALILLSTFSGVVTADGNTSATATDDNAQSPSNTDTIPATIIDHPTVGIAKSDNAPPRVVCVPGVATNLLVSHYTWNENTVILKGTAHDPDGDVELTTYKWEFGDGTNVTGAVTNPYQIQATHIYPHSPDGTPYTASLTVWDSHGAHSSDTYPIVVKTKTLDVEVNVLILLY